MPDVSLLDSLITKLISVMCGHKSKIVSINHSTVGDAFTWPCGHRKNICCQKNIYNSFSFEQLQKWFLHKNGLEFNHKSKSKVCNVWPVAGWSRKTKNLRKDAHKAEISYEPLVAHSAFPPLPGHVMCLGSQICARWPASSRQRPRTDPQLLLALQAGHWTLHWREWNQAPAVSDYHCNQLWHGELYT